MSFHLDKEQISAACRAWNRERLDPSSMKFVTFENVHCLGQGPRSVLGLEQQGRAIVACALWFLIADNRKSRHVSWIVFDVLRQNIQVVMHAGLDAGNG